MEKGIYIFLSLFFIAGVTLVLLTGESELNSIALRDVDNRSVIDTGNDSTLLQIPSRKRYDLLVEQVADSKLTWKIDRADGGYEDFIMDENVLVYSFEDTGTFRIRAFAGMKLAGERQVVVVPGEQVDFRLPYAAIYTGEKVAFTDASTGVASRQWSILTSEGKLVFDSDEPVLEWVPAGAGNYVVELKVQTASDRTLSKTHDFTVENRPKPVVEKPKPVEKTVVAEERKPLPSPVVKEPAEPKPKPPVKSAPVAPDASFIANFAGTGKTKIGPNTPDKSKVTFKTQPVVITVTPKVNLRLSQFSFWGNYNTGKYTLKILCIGGDPSGNEVSYEFRTGNDEYAAQVNKLANKLGLIAGKTYEISIIPESNTQMGYAKPGKKSYENDFLSMEFKSAETSVFELSFLK